jgi:hypothetical protein
VSDLDGALVLDLSGSTPLGWMRGVPQANPWFGAACQDGRPVTFSHCRGDDATTRSHAESPHPEGDAVR